MPNPADAGATPGASDEVTSELDRLKSENEALRRKVDRRAQLRRWLAVTLVILTTVGVVATTVAVWAHQTVFDTDAFMDTVGPAIEDPAVVAAVSDYASEQAIAALDIEARVTDGLTRLDEGLSQRIIDTLDVDERALAVIDRLDRPTLAALSPPITTALETRVTEVVDRVITSERFSTRFPEIVRSAHAAAVAVVRGDLADFPNVSVVDGNVQLNLLPVMAEILRDVAAELRGFGPDITVPAVVSDRIDEGREQLAAALGARLPDDFGQITVMSADRLSEIQEGANRLDRLVWLLALVTLVLALLTIVVAPNRRRTTIQLAIAIVAAFAVGMVVLRRLDEAILDSIVDPGQALAARSVVSEVLSGLRSGAIILVGIAAAIGVGAYVAGRPPWLTRLVTPGGEGSELDQRIARHYDLLRILGAVVAFVVVFITGIELIPVALVGAALAVYLWAISEARQRVPVTVPDVPEPVTPGRVPG